LGRSDQDPALAGLEFGVLDKIKPERLRVKIDGVVVVAHDEGDGAEMRHD